MIRIHREGKTILFFTLAFMVMVIILLDYLIEVPRPLLNTVIVIFLILYIFLLQFFRDPPILIQKNDRFILSPADGKVVIINEAVEDEYFKDQRLQVSIFMSPVNVHVNRAPVGGKVLYFKYHKGKYLVAWHPKSSVLNERTTVVMEGKTGVKVLFRQIAGILARRIKYYIKEGDNLEQGQEFGFIKFGSRVDLFLPVGTRVLVKMGDQVKGGITRIGELE